MDAHAVVDFGTGYTKWMLRSSAGRIRREMYPSIVAILGSEADVPADLDVTPIRIGEKVYVVGPDSGRMVPATAERFAPGEITPEVWRAAHLGAMARMGERTLQLMTTFGPKGGGDHKFKWWEHSFEVPVGGCRAAQKQAIQVEGFAFWRAEAAIRAEMERTCGGFAAPATCFLDLGSATLCAAHRFGAVRIEGGMRGVYDRFDRAFASTLGLERGSPSYRYDNALENCKGPNATDAQKLLVRQVQQAAHEALEGYLDRVEQELGSIREARWLALSGGGAEYLVSAVRQRYPAMEVVVHPEPQWALVRGMLQLALDRERESLAASLES